MRVAAGLLAAGMLAALACGGGASPSGFDAASGFAAVTAARAELAVARARLERANAASGGAGRVSDAGVRDAQASFDAAYAHSQRVLARFLTAALNEAPQRAETRAALALYAGDAVASARYVLEHDGQRAGALADLERARTAYAALGLAAPAELAAAIDDLGRAPRPTPTAAPSPSGGSHGRAAGPRRAGARRRPAAVTSSPPAR